MGSDGLLRVALATGAYQLASERLRPNSTLSFSRMSLYLEGKMSLNLTSKPQGQTVSPTHRAMAIRRSAKQHVAALGLISTVRCGFGRHTGPPVETRWKGSPYPIWLRAGTSDIQAYLQVLVGEEYDFPLNLPATIIDAGANVGLASIWFTSRYPSARVIAVEPEKSNYAILARNVAPFANVIPVRAALWCHSGTLEVDDPNDEGPWAFQTRELAKSPSSVQKVPCLTVSELMSEYDLGWVDLLKVDIEGAEKEVFSSPDEWIGSVGAIAIELHDRFKAGCSRSFYAAVTGFPVEQRRGENVFVAR
jgi:FkbM family methyltransferase